MNPFYKGLTITVTRPPSSDTRQNLWTDLRRYFLRAPEIPTLVSFDERELREEYTRRIAQRVGIDVSKYSVLNIHRIGIDAPVRHVYEEIVRWRGQSPYWPNHVATLEMGGERAEDVTVVLFGRSIGGWLWRSSGGRLGVLFRMHIRAVRPVPSSADLDNARYLLWDCRGGYPIGVFSVFARSPIASRGETESTQLFFAVGFDPHGLRALASVRPVRRVWEGIHDRVTGNVLNRFKRVCETSFASLRSRVPPSA